MTRTLPVLGFVGSSGSGKTTLLERVVALLADTGVRLAVIKHAKPGFDVDPNPRKDSHRLRTAGAEQLLVASRDRWVLMAQQADPLREPSLREMLGHLDAGALDGVLVEGFVHERYEKIEVYRPAHGRPPQCWPHDPSVVAVASDAPRATGPVCWLDLNDPAAVAQFVVRRLGLPESCAESMRLLAGDANRG
ncbi:MAG: molybdopterin-guanine dinucleotide biosynthesis protein B [Gemmatimonadales bacterium]